MKPHRIFIAINVPEDVKNTLLSYQENWADLPARWTTKENLHLTLTFLGNTSDQELEKVLEVMQEVGKRHQVFSLEFTRIIFGPSQRNPKMIWVQGESSQKLLELQKDIEQTLSQQDSKSFSPHLTLARLNAFQFHQMETEELPDVNEEISLSCKVTSVEVMESHLRRSGAQYIILQSFMLKQ